MDSHISMELKQLEFARTVGVHKPNENYFRVRIPKLMANITQEKRRVPINNTMFVNSSECMITPSNMVTTQNYITVPRTHNCDLSHVTTKIDDEVVVPDNTPVICACFYGSKCIAYLIDSYPLLDAQRPQFEPIDSSSGSGDSSHTHHNIDILNATTAPFTIEDKAALDKAIEDIDVIESDYLRSSDLLVLNTRPQITDDD